MRVGVSCGKKRFIILIFFVCVLIFFLTVWCAVRMHTAYVSLAGAYANTEAQRAISNSVNAVFSDKMSEITSVKEYESAMIFSSDTANVNLINANLITLLQDEFARTDTKTVYIPLGTVTGIAVFSGMGPKIPIKLHPITVISTDFKESFSSSGINQVRHSISVMVDIKMAYSGYMFNSSEKISISVPVTNTVIIGEVPQYYGANSMEMVR